MTESSHGVAARSPAPLAGPAAQQQAPRHTGDARSRRASCRFRGRRWRQQVRGSELLGFAWGPIWLCFGFIFTAAYSLLRAPSSCSHVAALCCALVRGSLLQLAFRFWPLLWLALCLKLLLLVLCSALLPRLCCCFLLWCRLLLVRSCCRLCFPCCLLYFAGRSEEHFSRPAMC